MLGRWAQVTFGSVAQRLQRNQIATSGHLAHKFWSKHARFGTMLLHAWSSSRHVVTVSANLPTVFADRSAVAEPSAGRSCVSAIAAVGAWPRWESYALRARCEVQ